VTVTDAGRALRASESAAVPGWASRAGTFALPRMAQSIPLSSVEPTLLLCGLALHLQRFHGRHLYAVLVNALPALPALWPHWRCAGCGTVCVVFQLEKCSQADAGTQADASVPLHCIYMACDTATGVTCLLPWHLPTGAAHPTEPHACMCTGRQAGFEALLDTGSEQSS
jgi:hypothetical protein